MSEANPRAIFLTLTTIACAIVAGALAAVHPMLLLVLIAALLLLLSLHSSLWRLITITFGGLIVLQGTAGLTAPKLAYFGYIVVTWIVALHRLSTRANRAVYLRPFRSLVPASLSVLAVVLVSGPIAALNGATFLDWARDALPFTLIALLPVIGLDCAHDTPETRIRNIMAIVGLVAAIGFAVDWLERRGVSALGVGKLTLSSIALLGAVFVLSVTYAGLGPRRARWFALAVLILIAVLLTGTRSSVILIAGLAGVLGSEGQHRVPLPKLTSVALPLTIVVVLALPILSGLIISDPDFLESRLQQAIDFLEGGREEDQSFRARATEYGLASEQIDAHPWFGVGPGHLYAVDPGSPPQFTLDTPLTVVAKFGVVGSTIIVAFLVQVFWCGRRVRLLVGPSIPLTALRGFAVLCIAGIPFGSMLEDKGLTIALMLLVSLVAARTRDSIDSQAHKDVYSSVGSREAS